MSDVRSQTAPAFATQSPGQQRGAFIWYELITPDVDGAKRFYDEVVGWTVAANSDFPNGYRMIGRSDGKFAGGMLPLTDEMREHGARPAWLGYIAVDEVDSALAAMESDGATALMSAFDIPGVGRIALVADPQGAPFYVMAAKPSPGQEDMTSDVFSPEAAQHVRWNELSTTDPDAAIDFYESHFGWRQEGGLDMDDMGEYRFLWLGSIGIGAVMPKMPQMPGSSWSYYFGVDDIGRALEAVRASGGQVLQEPMEIPGGEFAMNALDPQGAAFGLVGPRKS